MQLSMSPALLKCQSVFMNVTNSLLTLVCTCTCTHGVLRVFLGGHCLSPLMFDVCEMYMYIFIGLLF